MTTRRTLSRLHRSIGPGSATWTTKKVLLGLLLLGVLSWGTTGTYAVLSSENANRAATVSTGTLTFSNTVNSGSACLSYGTATANNNINNACSAVISESSGLVAPGGSILAAITIKNNGSIAGSDLSLYMPTCTATTTSTYTGGVNGSGNLCAASGGQFYVQESSINVTLSSSLSTGAPITSLPVTALNGTVTSGTSVVVSSGTHTQTFTASSTVNAGATSIPVNSLTPNFAYPSGSIVFNPTTCWSPSQAGACPFNASTLFAFQLNHGLVTNALDLGTGPAAGASRYFVVGMAIPPTASINYMGQAAAFALTWHLTTF